ncbi:hypothetical protein OnM2_027083 [Erysiphe neolycopersici]|uniref:Uncharacterized protein n=1 Tax=Erysiphe neolycopersici TaxID=212602 RepID=A0A420I0K4_9PEZI|nr:hypothetical protein OnM2_027083 [Erysiphe neolycopersici]
MFVMGVKEKYPIWAERQRSNIRTNHDITLASLIADLTDEARESSHERNTELAMSAHEKSKGKFHAHINSVSKGRFQHCKCCGNPQARHSTEKCFEDPRNREAKAAWEKKNNKKWTDFKTKKANQKARKGVSSNSRGGSSDDDEPSSFEQIAISAKI